MAIPADVTDPGTTNPGDQAFGQGAPADVTPGSVVARQFASASVVNLGFSRVGGKNDAQSAVPGLGIAATVTDPGNSDAEEMVPIGLGLPSQVSGETAKPGLGVAVTVNDPGSSNAEEMARIGLGLPPLVSGDASRPGRTPVDVIENDVVNQVYGTGTPRNVFV